MVIHKDRVTDCTPGTDSQVWSLLVKNCARQFQEICAQGTSSFLSGVGTSMGELQKRAEYLEALTIHHNEILTKSNINPLTDKPLAILSEKCLLCDFTSHTTQGIKIHKGKMHKNNK